MSSLPKFGNGLDQGLGLLIDINEERSGTFSYKKIFSFGQCPNQRGGGWLKCFGPSFSANSQWLGKYCFVHFAVKIDI